MSKIISFRINENNPREKQAYEILSTLINKGYSARSIMINALIQIGADGEKERMDLLFEMNEKLSNLLHLMEQDTPKRGAQEKINEDNLRSEFVNSIKKAARPGIRVS